MKALTAQMIYWTKNAIRTARDWHSNGSIRWESIGSLFSCSNGLFLRLDIRVGIQSGYSFYDNWIFTFWVLEGGDRQVEKYRFFEIDPLFSHFTMKQIPRPCKNAP